MGKYDGKHLVYRVNGEVISRNKDARSKWLDNMVREWAPTVGQTFVNCAVSVTRSEDGNTVTVVTNEGETLVLSIE